MTDVERIYEFLKLHPKADNSDLMQALDWDSHKVRQYKYRLKKKGYIATDHEDGQEVAVILKELDASATKMNEALSFKQQTYREMAEAYLERINDAGTSIGQMIELGRELRLILKELN